MTDPPAFSSSAPTTESVNSSATVVKGYGRSGRWDHLIFDGNERNYEMWEVKMLSYMRLRGLKSVINLLDAGKALSADDRVKNEEAFVCR